MNSRVCNAAKDKKRARSKHGDYYSSTTAAFLLLDLDLLDVVKFPVAATDIFHSLCTYR